MVWLGFSLILVLLTASLIAASLRLPSFTSFALAVYLLALAEIVLLTEMLSTAHWVDRSGYVVLEVIVAVAALTAWFVCAKPVPAVPAIPFAAALRHPTLLLLTVAVGVALGFQLYLVVGTPPHNWDSMTYHLARAAEWYQRGAVEYYPAHTTSVNAMQPNAEILALFTFAHAGRDTVAAAPQLVAEAAAMIAVFGVTIRLGFSRPESLFAALLTATLSQVALQSVTTQNDLLVAALSVAALYFVLGSDNRELALASLAIGLAVGTKATAVIAVPVLVLAAVLVLDRRRLTLAAGFSAFAFAIFGAYGYVQNVASTNRLLGDPPAAAPIQPERTIGVRSQASRA